MDLIRCPVCGEKYSSSYRRCPFCEEEDRPRKVSGKRRGGHHVAERKHTHSARGPLIAVLLVVLVVFSWYLFGGKFMEKIQDDSGRFDCTIRMSDSIQLILRGTDAAATWSSEDTSVVTVSADGKLKPVKAGTANVTASVGGATVRCVVRINN